MADDQHKQPNYELPSELQGFEAQLASLQPTTGRLERDRLMFEAGQAAAAHVRRSSSAWVWPAVSFLTTTAAIFMAAIMVLDSGALAVKDVWEEALERPVEIVGGSERHQAPGATERDDVNEQPYEAPGRMLAALLADSDDTAKPADASYFRQRSVLLAYGGDRPPKLNDTPSARGGRSNTRVSYMDLLDELTLETHGFAPRVGGSNDLKP